MSVSLILEGGSITVDGQGTLVTTEQCLLNPNRNPQMARDRIEDELREHLGVHRIVWLGRGLVEDHDCDGHVDLVCAFIAPSRVVLLVPRARSDPNWGHAQENLRRLENAGIEVVTLDAVPRLTIGGRRVAVSPLNFALCNGGVVVPLAATADDQRILETVASCYPEREVVGVPATVLAYGGGGVHCITQQIPVCGA